MENKFFERTFDKGRLKKFVRWFVYKWGLKKTISLLDTLKFLGFKYARFSGISLNLEDLYVPAYKDKVVKMNQFQLLEQEFKVFLKNSEQNAYSIKFIATWTLINELLRDSFLQYFKNRITPPFYLQTSSSSEKKINSDKSIHSPLFQNRANSFESISKIPKIKSGSDSLYIMAFSGARGNMSQVSQLTLMRGLMSDPLGKLVEFPIVSNFKEGLNLTEYLISCYGARKGIIDTGLRTATAGDFTRRLVDVAHSVIIQKFDCGTQNGIYLSDLILSKNKKNLFPLKQRLIGRIIANNSRIPENYRNKEISLHFFSVPLYEFQNKNSLDVKNNQKVNIQLKKKFFRARPSWKYLWNPKFSFSPQNYKLSNEIQSFFKKHFVQKMELFSPCFYSRIYGQGFTLKNHLNDLKPFSFLLMLPSKILFEFASSNLFRKSKFDFSYLFDSLFATFQNSWFYNDPFYGIKSHVYSKNSTNYLFLFGTSFPRIFQKKTMEKKDFLFLPPASSIRENHRKSLLLPKERTWNDSFLFISRSILPKHTNTHPLTKNQNFWSTLNKNSDSINKIGVWTEKFLSQEIAVRSPLTCEASPSPYLCRKCYGQEIAVRSPLTCEASPSPYLCRKCYGFFGSFFQDRYKTQINLAKDLSKEKINKFEPSLFFKINSNSSIKSQTRSKEALKFLLNKQEQSLLRIDDEGKTEKKSWSVVPSVQRKKFSFNLNQSNKLHNIILKYSLVKILQKIVNNVQAVYRGQGVEIYDQHIEVLISQMGSKIRIKENFDSKFFWNEMVPLNLIKDHTEIQYEPILSGITRISLQTDSFISAASFQSSSKILSQESLKKSKDFLFGLKESIIVNELIPSGTGIFIAS
nr:RNA polymerase beta'' subunit [Trentepohlia sp. YN1242]